MVLLESDIRLKISILTVCYNAAATLSDTLESVASQTYTNVEHIVVDGGSTDGTVDMLKVRDQGLTKWVSERDHGIYDAMNKGILMAAGDVVGTLNADDFYMNNHVLEDIAQVFSDSSIDACYGDLIYVSQNDVNHIVRLWKSNDYKLGLFKSGWMPAHPTFFVRKSVYERLGGFNLDYKIAADFELMFRFIEQEKIKTKYVPKILVRMRLGGTTNQSFSNIVKQNKEIFTILRHSYGDFSKFGFISKKIFNRLLQFLAAYKIRFIG